MRRQIATVAAGVLIAGSWAAVPAAAQTPAWSVVPSANPVGDNFLAAVSCVSPVACVAVGGSGFATGGASGLSGGTLRTLAESWDGSRWSILPSPNRGTSGDDLSSVSCSSADACMAVGAAGHGSGPPSTLAESWDGSRWSVVPSPDPGTSGDSLDGVSCVSRDACMAVGGSGFSSGILRTLAESWDGTRWSVVPSPDAGTSDRLDGGVSCVSADDCVAAGNAYESNGFHASLVESWDGSRWSVVPSPSPGAGFTEVYGLSCATDDACAIAGYYNVTGGAIRTLIETWNGTAWSVVPSPSPGVINHELVGVSCFSPTTCTAVGHYYSRHGLYRTLVESGPVG